MTYKSAAKVMVKKINCQGGELLGVSKWVFSRSSKPPFLCQKSVKKQSNTEGPICRAKNLILNDLHRGFNLEKWTYFECFKCLIV